MKNLAFIFTISYIIVVVYLLWISRRNREKYVKVKTTASFLFVATSITSFLLGNRESTSYFIILFLGLLFCLLGDFFLGLVNHEIFANLRFFKIGAASFTIAHIFFCILFYFLIGFYWFDFVLPIILVVMANILKKAGLVRFNKLMKIVNIYTIILGVMATKAVEVALWGKLNPTHSNLLLTGAMMFLISDIILFFVYFGKRKKSRLSLFNLSFYYIGCYLLALTAYFL